MDEIGSLNEGEDPGECGIRIPLDDFNLDLNQPDPAPIITRRVANNVQSDSDSPQSQAKLRKVESTLGKTVTVEVNIGGFSCFIFNICQGQFGVKLYILEDMPAKLVSLMMGNGHFPLIGLTIPKLTIAFSAQVYMIICVIVSF